MANLTDYIEAGFRVMGLHSVDKNGCCTCGNKKCEALFKHPYSNNWQHSPHWSDQQLETMHKLGQFQTGFGVLVNESLIIDIDPRNGGNQGYAQLCRDTGIDYKKESGFVVATGGGGWHIYFTNPDNLSLLTHHKSYEGVDFKSSGFVVGCGSMHKSGIAYEKEKGHPSEVTPPPQKLIDLLQRKETHRATVDGATVDVSDQELVNMLAAYKNDDLDYEDWIRVGMALHHSTNGDGFTLWDDWSKTSDKYSYTHMNQKWHSFGKSASPVTLGTLLHHAKEHGYQESVEFTSDLTYAAPVVSDEIDISGVDLNRPPSFVGELTDWVIGNSKKKSDTVAVATALSIVGNAAGLNYTSDDAMPAHTNMFIFCVAESGLGKGAFVGASNEVLHDIGLGNGIFTGGFKSQQAIVRNMVSSQMVAYNFDEVGLELQQLTADNAPAYKAGIITNLMKYFSAGGGVADVEKELIIETVMENNKQIARYAKMIENNEDKSGFAKVNMEQLMITTASLKQNNGIKNPFMSFLGFTTGVTFNGLVDANSVNTGFFSRTLIFTEKRLTIRRDKNFKGKQPLPDQIKSRLLSMCSSGDANNFDRRIQNNNDKKVIPTTQDGKDLLEKIEDYFEDQAELFSETNGLHALSHRAFELICKVSLVLAIADGLRTAEHIVWAYALIRRDIDYKAELAYGNSSGELRDIQSEVCNKLLSKLSAKDEKNAAKMTAASLYQSMKTKTINKKLIEGALEHLLSKGMVVKEQNTNSRRGITNNWFRV